jgi:hypothetical protein
MKEETLRDLLKDCPCGLKQWCLSREMIMDMFDDVAEQIRLVYTLKFFMSEKAGYDVGKKAAWDLWINGGFAKKFREIYKEGMKQEDLEREIFKKDNDEKKTVT